MINLFLCTRSRHASYQNLTNLIQSLQENTKYHSNMRVYFKFDDNDPCLKNMEALVSAVKEFEIQFIITPQANGYLDLHKGYNDLYVIAKSAALYCVLADDVSLVKDWDEVIITAHLQGIDSFGKNMPFTLHQDNPFMGINYTKENVIERNEPWPIWTKEWLDIVGGFGQSPTTDAFTSCIELELINHFQFDPRIILSKKIIFRHVTSEDTAGSERFDVIRKKILMDMLGPNISEIIRSAAKNIYNAYFVSAKIDPNQQLNNLSPNILFQKGFEAIFKDNNSVSHQSVEMAKIMMRGIVPSLQRDADWNNFFKELIKILYQELVNETNPTYAISWFTACIKDMVKHNNSMA